jgi:hypothetical protein
MKIKPKEMMDASRRTGTIKRMRWMMYVDMEP